MVEFSVGIVTVSDSCSAGTSVDTSGPRLLELVKQSYSSVYRTEHVTIPDDLETIKSTLTYFSDALKLNLILTTGGTGFSKRDLTPEATRAVIDREAPQMSLAMSLVSFQKTKFAALSRAVCGIRQSSLIVNMPGSRKAVEECFEPIRDVIPHAIELIVGETKGIAETHRILQSSSKTSKKPSFVSIPHVCPHKTNSGAVDDRNSPFPMIEVDEALSIILSKVEENKQDLNIRSPINIPEFRASIKDGYAVKSNGGKGVKRVVGYISAGDAIRMDDFGSDECFKINTGAPIPHYADCVIQIEDTKLTRSDNMIEKEVEILIDTLPGLDIRPIGNDLAQGEYIFRSTDSFPGVVAYKSILASVGVKCDNLPHDNCTVAIISTGDELKSPGEKLEEGKIFDSNTTMLKTLLERHGFKTVQTIKANDSFESMKSALQNASNNRFIIFSGSVSMGDKDFLKDVLKQMNFDIHFGRVNMKPGKPMTFSSNASNDCAVFGLPGNPVSAFVCFNLFVLPALRKYSGYSNHQLTLPKITVELINDEIELDMRPEFVRARIISQNGKLLAEVTDNQMSSRLTSIAGADVLLEFPGRKLTRSSVKAGEQFPALVLKQHFISIYK